MKHCLSVVLILCLACAPLMGCSTTATGVPPTTRPNIDGADPCSSTEQDASVEDQVFFIDDAEVAERDEGYAFEPPEAVAKALFWTVAIPTCVGIGMLGAMIESGYSHSWEVGD